jgi:hypothetical protein
VELPALAAIQEVTLHRDLLDNAAAWGGIVGGLAALGALFLAWLSKKGADRSADEAQRSADAAERSAKAAEDVRELTREQVRLTREQADLAAYERSRRADLRVDLQGKPVGNNYGKANVVILAAKLWNDGSRSADEVRVGVAVPQSVNLRRSVGPDGGGYLDGEQVVKSEALESRGHVCGGYRWAGDVGPLKATGVPEERYFEVGPAPMEAIDVEISMAHDDVALGEIRRAWRVQAISLSEVRVEPLDAASDGHANANEH